MIPDFKHIKLKKIASTNVYLHHLSETKKVKEWTVVTTQEQTNGKGQKGSTWQTKPGDNLTFSVLLNPEVDPKHAFYLNIISALAVYKTLSDLGIESKIKWPNDILVNKQKIAGILVENQIGFNIKQSVIGIGLNVNQTEFKSSLNATSIILKTQYVELLNVQTQLLGYLAFYYNLLQQSNFKLLLKLYYSHMYLFNEIGCFYDGKSKFKAILLGITDVGLLKLKKQDNQICTYDIKDIKFIF